MENNFKKGLKSEVNLKEVVENHNKSQEKVYQEREEAIEIATKVAEKLKKEKGKVTKEDILDYLLENDFKAFQIYRTWITVLCSNGLIPEVEKENFR